MGNIKSFEYGDPDSVEVDLFLFENDFEARAFMISINAVKYKETNAQVGILYTTVVGYRLLVLLPKLQLSDKDIHKLLHFMIFNKYKVETLNVVGYAGANRVFMQSCLTEYRAYLNPSHLNLFLHDRANRKDSCFQNVINMSFREPRELRSCDIRTFNSDAV